MKTRTWIALAAVAVIVVAVGGALALKGRQPKAEEVETTASTLEALQRPQDRIVINALFRCNSNCRCRIQGVMTSWRIQGHVQQFFVLTREGEMPLRTNLFVLFHTDISIFAETISGDLTPDTRQQLADHRIVYAHHRASIERQVMQEVDESLF